MAKSPESETLNRLFNRPFELFDDFGVQDLSGMKGDDYKSVST